ncbi:hypothetical protein [Phenylobacterium sp. NIBR 498073]|uniref:hypothetical protein n=1 Tax=Phenylobacterium sp. NIBR 498073 TaxID=3015177 RepID=UPI0022B45C29|nr:hypothetical protein [Phenylobacterium sp. NIBR 498073]WGU40923.1 hypothetical protein O4N75_04155 [Phenylobacterium sp. NIBR 498073]
MWLLVFVPAVLGILRYRYFSYWRWVGAMWLWQAAATYLFASNGSLVEPERDGLISRAIRQATDDGPLFGLYGIIFLVVFYSGVAYIVRRLYVEGKPSNHGAIARASKGRKAVELTALALVTGGLLYLNFASMSAPSADAPAAMSVEAMIDDEIAASASLLPLKVDEITILTSARREQQKLVLNHEITKPAQSRDVMLAFLESKLPAEACANAGVRGILQSGGSVSYRYRFIDDVEPVAFDLTAALCAPQKNSSISR